MSPPLVSVTMPAYNAAQWLPAAIMSMQSQTYQDWELCIVNDGSTDTTWDVMLDRALLDNRIRIVDDAHKGCPSARNTAFALSTGDIIARLDADDVHDPERLERQVAALLADDSLDMVTSGYGHLLPDGSKRAVYAPAMDAVRYLGGGQGPCCASVVAWRYVYEGVGDFDTSLLAGSDADWAVRAVRAGFTWGHLPEPLYWQRRHPGQLSATRGAEQREAYDRSRQA